MITTGELTCVDTGCESHYGGLGQCVNMTATRFSEIEINYDLDVVQPSNR